MMAKGKIFYLDDEPELLEFVEFVLKRYKYDVIVKEKWDDKYLDELEDVDMIILDIMFPEGQPDGYEVCRRIKGIEKLGNIPIYMFSAKAFSEDKEEALENGADGFIEKPVPIDNLVKLVEKVVEEKKKNDFID
ncbi:response regulator transcription factor [Haliovirga abyssi]|uniref:Response regulatory domain-containing protein n=1 Tax=Haliovirga abyssi TaxID=2996794 RepID=A0AAU9DPD5_9FUSO|nr:response regulator [Haliovirga abyssi]BDU50278.1 hypothetical protein HLVA_08470 [Haliovirga abyssi]